MSSVSVWLYGTLPTVRKASVLCVCLSVWYPTYCEKGQCPLCLSVCMVPFLLSERPVSSVSVCLYGTLPTVRKASVLCVWFYGTLATMRKASVLCVCLAWRNPSYCQKGQCPLCLSVCMVPYLLSERPVSVWTVFFFCQPGQHPGASEVSLAGILSTVSKVTSA